jgi:hypothetical protein
LFQSIQVTFITFGLGVTAIFAVCGLILSCGVLNECLLVHIKKDYYSALVDVQQAPRHLAFAKGDEEKGLMTGDGDGRGDRACDVFGVG